MIYFLLWWLIIEIFGWLALPLAMRVLRFLPDRGYTFSKALGLLVVSYLLWIGASAGLLSNDLGGIFLAVFVLIGISFWFFRQEGLRKSLVDFVRENKRLVWSVEALFTVAFILWAALRAYAPYKIMQAGGEKTMEIAFLNAILNSKSFPPLDPWLSGFAISYYYFGYVMMALVTRLSGAPAGIGFDLYDALLFALTVVGAFGIVYNLVATASAPKETGKATAPLRYGLLGSLFVAVVGNWEGLLEGLYSAKILSLNFWKWINIPDLLEAPANGSFFPSLSGGWWWWRASRVIRDLNLDYQVIKSAQPISEFPFFSFLLGDNHPHVLALPFVLLATALALNLVLGIIRHDLAGIKTPVEEVSEPRPAWWNPVAYALGGDWLLFLVGALVLGGLAFLNTWDFPIYLGLTLLAYAAGIFALTRRLDNRLILRFFSLGIGLSVVSIFLYIFFYFSFSSQAGGILPYVFPPTRLPQYLVMFGPFLAILIWFLAAYRPAHHNGSGGLYAQLRSDAGLWGLIILVCIFLFVLILLAAVFAVSRQASAGTLDPVLQTALGSRTLSETLQTILSARLRDPWLFLVLSLFLALAVSGFARASRAQETRADFQESDLFVFLLVFTGLALTLVTEFFYLRDSFGYRMNTIFKFYYQGWIMLGCASAYAIWWIANPGKRYMAAWLRLIALGLSLVVISAGMIYPLMAFYSRANGFQSTPNLDGASEFAHDNSDDWAAIQWLRQNALKGASVPVILEAPGTSYTYEGRISAFTGIPAVLGWAIHESQWRGNYDEQGKREPDIITIYTTSDVGLTFQLLHKWQVSYVILGQPENNYIQRQCQDPARRCSLVTVLRKFEQALYPVFTQGGTTIYQVP